MKKSKSKYLGRYFNGWKVVSKKEAPGNHSIYTLKTKKGLTIKTMTVRDNELTRMAGGKSIWEESRGKDYQLSKKIRVPQNTVLIKKSLFNLFRSI